MGNLPRTGLLICFILTQVIPALSPLLASYLLGDCLKLQAVAGEIRKAVIVIGYEHTPPQISLLPLLLSFELLAREVMSVRLGTRVQVIRTGLIHPVHQQLTVAAGFQVASTNHCLENFRQPAALTQTCILPNAAHRSDPEVSRTHFRSSTWRDARAAFRYSVSSPRFAMDWR